MLKSVEAIIDKNGQVTLREDLKLSETHRAIVTVLDEAEDRDFSQATPEDEDRVLGEAGLKWMAEATPEEESEDWEKQQ
ncbi:MAG: hypothetical protein ACFCVE_03290 [Phycisphaerae bacterium]